MNMSKHGISESSGEKKYPILITVCFFLITSLVSFFYHDFWTIFDQDGLIYLSAGQQILEGTGSNVSLPNSGPAGPILFATLEIITNNGLYATKLVSVISGTAIVFFSYHVFRNIFNYKIAILGQVFIAFNPWVGILSISSLNDLAPISLAICSIYFITKNQLRFSNIIISASLLGIGFMFRTQPIIFFLAIIIFILFLKQDKNFKIKGISLFIIFFILFCSPMLYYNSSTYGVIFDSNTNYYVAAHSKYWTPEWKDYLFDNMTNDNRAFLSDFNLFLKNYFYNLLYGQPSNLFGFENKVSASLIPAIPIIGLIPVLGGFILFLKISNTKKTVLGIIMTSSITTGLIFLLGNIQDHFFAIIIAPIIFLGIQNLKKLDKKFILLITICIIFSLLMAVLPLRSYKHFLYLWIFLAPLCSFFIISVISKLTLNVNPQQISSINIFKNSKTKFSLFFIVATILIINVGYSYVTLEIITTGNSADEIIQTFFNPSEHINKNKIDYEKITSILKSDPDIENKYVMANYILFADVVNAKWVGVQFQEGPEDDSIENYITRKNWKNWQIFFSNISSEPMDRNGENIVIPDYIIYNPKEFHLKSLQILSEPDNQTIPKSFELLYNSPHSGITLYKINHQN